MVTDYTTVLQSPVLIPSPTKKSYRLATNVDEMREDPELIHRIATSLVKAELFEHAGELYEKVGKPQDALSSYCKGQAFSRAVELARHAFPSGGWQVCCQSVWGSHGVKEFVCICYQHWYVVSCLFF